MFWMEWQPAKEKFGCLKSSAMSNRFERDSNLLFEESASATEDQSKCSRQEYVNLCFLLPTRHVCERVFLEAGFVFYNYRRSLSPVNFES